MPLFKAKISIASFVEIPVFAESLEEASKYINSTREWVDDSTIEEISDSDSEISFVSLTEVDSPHNSPWESDVYCWNGGLIDIGVSDAFYSEKLDNYFRSEIEVHGGEDNVTDEKLLDAYNKLHGLKEELREEFDLIRSSEKLSKCT